MVSEPRWRMRAAEFQGLVSSPSTSCEGPSRFWSCVQVVPQDACNVRPKVHFGISARHAKTSGRPAGLTEDSDYDSQIPLVPRLSDGPGYLVMNMTEKLQRLLPWYASVKESSVEPEGYVDGGYLDPGSSKTGTLLVSLDTFYEKRMLVEKEMQDVLEWWTQQQLKHSSTFGIRIYKRGAVLLNHVDRHDTHLASAVLQVDQKLGKKDVGWPLEILTKDRDCVQVFLRPGQMVLYEGAHFKHGRPMRFRGNEYANIFSHFAPARWTGIQDEL